MINSIYIVFNMKTIELNKMTICDETFYTLPRLWKPLQDYRKAVRKAIGFMNTHRDPNNYHDDGSPEYYIRRELCELAEALEALADKADPNERDRETYSELLGRPITDETLEQAKQEWKDMWEPAKLLKPKKRKKKPSVDNS